MANMVGYKPLANPDWISVTFDDGTESPPVNDPLGEYRTQVDDIAKKVAGVPPDPMKAATASLGSELVGGASAGIAKADVPPSMGISAVGAVSPPVSGVPGAAADAGGESGFAAVGKALGKQAMKGAAIGQPGAPAGPGAPPPAPGPSQPPPGAPTAPAKPPGLMVTDTTSSWQRNKSEQRGTTGISEADRPGVVAAQEGAVKSAEVANEADYAARANQLWTEWGRYSDQAKSRIAEKAALQDQELKFNESLQGAYKSLDAVAARKVDPAQAFAGEKGWYAFMAGFGDVLRNVGAALAGKAPVVDPGAVMDQLVERSVNLQLAQKEADYKAGRIGIERLTADRETTRHRLGVVITQLAESELGKAQSQQSYQALGALKAKGDAIVADARAKAAAALARQETITKSTSDVSGGTVQRGLPKAGGDALGDLSKMLDIEKKKLELQNQQLDNASTDDVAAAIGRNVSPDRAKQIRDTVKENAAPLAKLKSFSKGLQEQLRINGATVNWDTGEVIWPKDIAGVSGVLPSDIIGDDPDGGGLIDTVERRLNRQQAFNKELLTTDTTGAVATPEQGETFALVLGGAGRNEDKYKAAVESTVKHIVARRNGFLTSMGEDGKTYYRALESKLDKKPQPNMTPIGTLPEGQR